MSSSNCCFLTCIQISQQADKVVWYSYLFKNFPQFVVIHTVKGFGIVNKAKICFSGALSLLQWSSEYWHLISGSSAFLKSCLNIWNFTVHVLPMPGLESFEHYFASLWDECNCAVVWAFFDIAFLWDFLVAHRVKHLPAMGETQAWFPGSGKSPGGGNGNPPHYSC